MTSFQKIHDVNWKKFWVLDKMAWIDPLAVRQTNQKAASFICPAPPAAYPSILEENTKCCSAVEQLVVNRLERSIQIIHIHLK